MINFFKPEDFNPLVSWTDNELAFITNKLLSERGVIVYSGKNIFKEKIIWNIHRDETMHTHQALLINIEELPKPECEHEPEIVHKSSTDGRALLGYYSMSCRKCGCYIKAASWSPA